MTNEEMLGVADIVERATNRFNAQAALIASMKADHEAKMVEHRAAFGARTEADAKIIAGLRSEIDAARMAVLERDSLISERDGLLTQVQDMRAEMERLKLACSTYAADWATAGNACRMRDNEYPLGAVIRLVRDDAERAEVAKRLVAERDALRAEGAELKTQLERLTSWAAKNQAARETLQNEIEKLKSQTPKQHPVKVGNVVEVVSNTGGNTWLTDVGSVGTVTSIETLEDSLSVRLKAVPDKKNVCGGYVSICDVRKVTT